MNPKISVIIPTYNSAKYISATVESVLEQTFADFELLICDDASTDHTMEIVRSFDDRRIQIFENEENMGAPSTRNRLIGLAKGEFVSVMDADDLALPRKLETQIEYMERHPEIGVCGTWSYIVDEKGGRIGKVKSLRQREDIRINLLFSSPFIHASVMFRAGVLDAAPYPPDYWPADDYALWCNLQDKTGMVNLRRCLTAYRWHGTNESVRQRPQMQAQRDRILTRQLMSLGITATPRELVLMGASFKSEFFDEKAHKGVDPGELEALFTKIVKANKAAGRYDPSKLRGYVWARWFAFCHLTGQMRRAFFPGFASANPAVLFHMCRLAIFFAQR